MSEERDNPAAVPTSDALLVEAFQTGKDPKAAFSALVIKYQDRVFNLCYRHLGNYEEADDCAQEAFLKVYRSLKDFRGDSAFGTWLYRIAVNTCKNRFMSQEYRFRRKTVSIDAPIRTEEGEVTLEIKDESLSPARELDAQEKASLIQEAIASLSDDQRQVVILRDVESLSYEEIARITGLNMGTVKSKLSRGRQAMCDKLRRLV
jgi:RNA polymerase sigma-70 factor, ECF subfamily